MTETRLRKSLGLFLIGSHFGLVILTLILFFLGGFLFEEMTTTLALIVPMFASYTTAIVRFIVKHRHRSDSSRQTSADFVIVAFTIPSLFVLCVCAILFIKAFNLAFQNFEQFKTLLAVVESLFAVYVGYFIAELFEQGGSRKTAPQSDPRPRSDH